MPQFMQDAKIVGGEEAPSMIPWQVAMLSGDWQFCGGTILDACTILTAAHCSIKTSHSIRAGSLNKYSGGQVMPTFSVEYFKDNNNIFYEIENWYFPSHI